MKPKLKDEKSYLKIIEDETAEDGTILYTTEPFEYDNFEFNCSECSYFWTQPIFMPGGKCTKHEISCGVGFVCEDYRNRAKGGLLMNFYEFNNYEYYALIQATDIKEAKQAYIENVANMSDSEINNIPDEISNESAFERMTQYYGCEEGSIGFNRCKNAFENTIPEGYPKVLLIDKSLL